MAKMKVLYTVSSVCGECKNTYIGLSKGRVKRMMRGKKMYFRPGMGNSTSIIREGGAGYVGAFFKGGKPNPSQLCTWPVDWHK